MVTALSGDPQRVDRAMDAFVARQPALPLAVTYSGGADSSALLRACVARWPGRVSAWHVHHGLQAAADDFLRHCQQVCRSLDVALHVRRVHVDTGDGRSVEDAARVARYAAFDSLAAEMGTRTVVLAQHADDQVETILLALSRGAGLPGLAAMPQHWRRGAVDFWRPLLAVPGPALRAWLRERDAAWIEDPTNEQERFVRNRIRRRLLPALEAVFPAFRTTFVRSAAHAAQAQDILAEIARQDQQACGVPPAIAALQRLSGARQANLLRHWLLAEHGQTPTAAQLAELQSQVRSCTTRGHRIDIRVGTGRLRRAGDVLVWQGAARRGAGGIV